MLALLQTVVSVSLILHYQPIAELATPHAKNKEKEIERDQIERERESNGCMYIYKLITHIYT